jgi:hypothetical protein
MVVPFTQVWEVNVGSWNDPNDGLNLVDDLPAILLSCTCSGFGPILLEISA